MAERFYLNLPLAPGLVELTGPEAHHLAQVCRLRVGNAVSLFNGDGNEYPGRIQSIHKKAVLIEIEAIESPGRELPFTLEVAAPLPKGDRAQFLIEKLTELGATRFIPLECERSVVHPGERKMEKLERYVIEASKQCRRNALMGIEPVMKWEDFLARRNEEDIALFAHPGGEDLRSQSFALQLARATIRVAVGPEGGFTNAEVQLAASQGWRIVSLGPRILRIETASIYMASIMSINEANLPR